MSVVPSFGVHWCKGRCGVDEICYQHTFDDGYCLEPKKRLKGVVTDVKPFAKRISNDTQAT